MEPQELRAGEGSPGIRSAGMSDQSPAVAAPEPSGEFVRVPREPTAAQWKAGDEAWADGINAIYRAMIQAAASPDEQKG